MREMEETLNDMQQRHKKEIKELQERCTHNNISDWMDFMWALGHFTGRQVKICNVCGKEIDRR